MQGRRATFVPRRMRRVCPRQRHEVEPARRQPGRVVRQEHRMELECFRESPGRDQVLAGSVEGVWPFASSSANPTSTRWVRSQTDAGRSSITSTSRRKPHCPHRRSFDPADRGRASRRACPSRQRKAMNPPSSGSFSSPSGPAGCQWPGGSPRWWPGQSPLVANKSPHPG